MVAGELRSLAVFDKPDPLEGPAFEETIYVTPSRLARRDLAAVLAATSAATVALGLIEGPVHAEVRVADGRASVIEVAARTIGGLCSRTLSFSTGRSLEELVIAHALGLALGETGAQGASGVLMVPIPRAGTLVGVEGQDEARQVPGVTDLQITIATGRAVARVPEGNRYLGFVFARDTTPARVERALRRAWACLEVRVEDGTDLRSRGPSTHPYPATVGRCASCWSRLTNSAINRCTWRHRPARCCAPAMRSAAWTSPSTPSMSSCWRGPMRWRARCPCTLPLRLARPVCREIRARRPDIALCLYGLYAGLDGAEGGPSVADLTIAGEYEPRLVAWADSLVAAPEASAPGPDAEGRSVVELGRGRFGLPARHLLPALDRYARLAFGDERRLVGYVEASHGCAHRCRHCPVPVVYDGRTRLVAPDAVVADVAQLVAMGARHITFGDPDFLNGPHHAARVIDAVTQHLPRSDLRRDGQGRAHPAPPRGVPPLGSGRVSVRSVGIRVRQRPHPRAARQGPHRRPGARGRRGPARRGDRAPAVASPLHALDAARRRLRPVGSRGTVRPRGQRGPGAVRHPAARAARVPARHLGSARRSARRLRRRAPGLVMACPGPPTRRTPGPAGRRRRARRRRGLVGPGVLRRSSRCDVWQSSGSVPRDSAAAPEPDPRLRSPLPADERPRLTEAWFCCAEPNSAQMAAAGVQDWAPAPVVVGGK